MKTTINSYQFIDAFYSSETYKNNFSYAGLNALFDYFEEYESSTGEELEFDMVAICCDFTEYSDLEEIQKAYPRIESMEDLQGNTQVIGFCGGIIIQNF